MNKNIIFFQDRNAHIGPLFKKKNKKKNKKKKKKKKKKFGYKVALEKCILISKSLYKTLAKILCNWFTLSFESETYNSRWAKKCSFLIYQILW